jgi:hypothetical protein
MRMLRVTAWIALTVAAMRSADTSTYGQDEQPAQPGRVAKPAQAKDQPPEAGDKDQRLTMKDIAQMRRDRIPYDKIVEKAAAQGVSFEVTPAVRGQLRRLGFKTGQINAIQDSYGPRAKPEDADNGGKPEKPAPVVPGQGLRTTDAQRDRTLEEIKKINKASGADLPPAEAEHVTLWAAKDIQAAFLPDIKKLEKFLQTKCKEPLRSGLDKRAAHVVLIKRRYEYEKWMKAMFDIMGDRFQQTDNPGGIAEWKASIIKGPGLFCTEFVVFCLEGLQPDYQHRLAAAGVGYMYFVQLAEYRQPDPLCTGFANGTETVVAGTPSVLIFNNSYGNMNRNLGADPKAWIHLVQQRIAARQVSPVGQLLKMDTSNMVLPNYAEAWSLVALLAQQPAKFAELVLALRENKAALEVIEKVYGWDEKKLTEEWHKYVLSQR